MLLLRIHAKQFDDFLKVAASVVVVASQFKRLCVVTLAYTPTEAAA
jgi:hypothetical protein